jgi:hypothetical protein
LPALLELQRGFARALLDERDETVCAHIAADGFGAAERLRIYRNTCRSTLVATLRMTYPAVEKLVGPAFFEHAAGRFVDCHPARSGYLNDYGAQFGAFLAAFEPARELLYLPDVARFEWALGIAANAADAPALDATALLLVPADLHADLRFAPHPSVSCLRLAFPADEIADAVMSRDEAAMGEVDLASGPLSIVVHRGRDGIQTERLEPAAYEVVSRLCAGEALGRVLESASTDAPAILAQQLAQGRLSAFATAP